MSRFDRLLQALCAGLFLRFGQKLRPYLLESLRVRILFILDLENVITVLGFHKAAQLARLQRKGRLFKVRDGLAAYDESQLATFSTRTGIFRVLLRQLCEVT